MLQFLADDAGQLRIEAANSASEQAICAAEEVKARERISLEADPLDDLVTSTPGKHRKLKWGFPCFPPDATHLMEYTFRMDCEICLTEENSDG